MTNDRKSLFRYGKGKGEVGLLRFRCLLPEFDHPRPLDPAWVARTHDLRCDAHDLSAPARIPEYVVRDCRLTHVLRECSMFCLCVCRN
ncbi:hypothetical protein NPIL_702331 [Nephila pilipes]|uniref:Uncharacterized protein n=1 Tax=Nephila pilipes TaxID=299642 RepID=A0A8X6N4Y9_NEPPI|nr:hypothetical protein NPIL_702331 [Nephila pilipes]